MPTRLGRRPSTVPARAAGAVAADAVAVLVFAAVGRRSHGEDVLGGALGGLAHTAWPFLAALALGWVAAVAVAGASARPAGVRAGAVVWLVTVLGGHGLRLAGGQGSAVSFLVVTALALAVLLLGWRALVGALERAGTRRRGRPGAAGVTPGR